MGRKISDTDEIQSRRADIRFEEGAIVPDAPLLPIMRKDARSPVEQYFDCLRQGEHLLQTGKLEEAGEVFTSSAQIALRFKNDLWLALSHEKLGDLSAAERYWFDALHNYHYALRTAGSALDEDTRRRLEEKTQRARKSASSLARAPGSDILPLSREYVSGNMAIAFVHRDIFLKSYFARCLECGFCHDACCSYGADVDIQNVEVIRQHSEGIRSFIRPSEVEWFEPGYTYEAEYTGNLNTRINPQGSRCVFISNGRRGCGLHSYALSQGMDYHAIKPLVCILFPLIFGEGILQLSQELDDDSLVCAGAGDSAYQSLRSELAYYFGTEFVDELDGMEKKGLGQ